MDRHTDGWINRWTDFLPNQMTSAMTLHWACENWRQWKCCLCMIKSDIVCNSFCCGKISAIGHLTPNCNWLHSYDHGFVIMDWYLSLSLAGNVIMLVVIFCYMDWRNSSTNYLITSIAISDFTTALVCCPISVSTVATHPSNFLFKVIYVCGFEWLPEETSRLHYWYKASVLYVPSGQNVLTTLCKYLLEKSA